MNSPKIILGIETSCDETAVAIVKNDNNRLQILSKVISSSALLQSKYGGVIPEETAREQLKLIIPTLKVALNQAKLSTVDIDAIAVTVGPGLIGSLLVGVETAKTLSLIWKKPLIPVNHLMAHFYANWVNQSLSISRESLEKQTNDQRPTTNDLPTFPLIGLLISGGHTDLILMKGHNSYQYLGGTRDDAAGECFDKCARILNLPYPGGPSLSKLAESGDPKRFKLPKPMLNSGDLDFSFSGLKTAFSRLVEEHFKLEPGHFDLKKRVWVQKELKDQIKKSQLQDLKDLCASLEQTIAEVLVLKTVKAAQTYHIDQVMLAGGVAANRTIAERFSRAGISTVLIPPPELCTDNAVMVAARGFWQKPVSDPLTVQANPNLDF